MFDILYEVRGGRPGPFPWPLFALMLLAAWASGCRGAERPETPMPPPNIVFIYVDDLGWRDVGFNGSTWYETPNIDRLAAGGMIFTDAYANGPNCAPSRASLMSGQYSPRHGIYTVNSPERGQSRNRKLIPTPNTTVLDSTVFTLTEALQAAGYTSISLGKWHMGQGSATGPVGQGFTYNVGGNQRGHPPTYFSPYRNEDIADGPEGEYLTDRLTEEAVRFIEQHKAGPFFVYLPYYAVHTPIQGKPALVEKYAAKSNEGPQNNPMYAAMVETVDQGVGRILATLDDLAISEQTLVVFYADNGGVHGITSMAPLRDGKGTLYEGGIRVPLAMRWPSVIAPGTQSRVPVIGIDFFPTFLEITGQPGPPSQILDGESLIPLLKQTGTLTRDALFWHFPAYLEANPQWYPNGRTWRTTPAGAIRQGSWKLIEYFEDGRLELYDLGSDPGETRNVAAQNPQTVEALHRRLQLWRESVHAPVPTTLNPDYVTPGNPAL